MAFNQSPNKSKHQFTARLVSNKTQATVSFVNITDDFARKVMGVNSATEATFAMAEETLPVMLNNDRVSVVLTDLTLERETVSVDEF